MHDLLTSLEGKELIATGQQKILDHNFSGIAKKLIESHIVFPSTAVFNVVRVTESVFHRHVVGAGTSVPNEKNTDLKIQSTVFEQMGTKVFSTNHAHFFDHKLGEERNHTSSLLELAISKYLHLVLTTYNKKFNELIVHVNKPSLRHTLTRTVLFKNQ